MRKHLKLEYCGTDGNVYHGKGIKARKRLEVRIKAYTDTVTRMKTGAEGFKKPGSMSK